eukprot:15118353-Heterocapsa_arctica.AAC.1
MNRDCAMDSSQAVFAIRTWKESMNGEGSSATLSIVPEYDVGCVLLVGHDHPEFSEAELP